MVEARNFQFLFYGLAAAWLIVIAYVFYLVQRDRRLTRELGRLKSMVDERAPKENGGARF